MQGLYILTLYLYIDTDIRLVLSALLVGDDLVDKIVGSVNVRPCVWQPDALVN